MEPSTGNHLNGLMEVLDTSGSQAALLASGVEAQLTVITRTPAVEESAASTFGDFGQERGRGGGGGRRGRGSGRRGGRRRRGRLQRTERGRGGGERRKGGGRGEERRGGGRAAVQRVLLMQLRKTVE